MANIIGEVFDEFVRDQINIRQFVLGGLNTTANDSANQWKFNNSAWVRMVSSVNISAEKAEQLGLSADYANSNLAKNFILYNGVSSISGSTFNPSTNNSEYFIDSSDVSIEGTLRNSYGFGGVIQGIRPMPGIESVKIGYINQGFLAQADIEITAFNREQLYLIDALFMHPGYTFLLEWGHTRYIDNSLVNNDFNIIHKDPNLITPAFKRMFSAKKTNTYELLGDIRQERQKRSGNYDGFFGTVKKFKYSYQPNGTYKITITAVNQGDIIENLKINSVDAEKGRTAKNKALDKQARDKEVANLKARKQLLDSYFGNDGVLNSKGKIAASEEAKSIAEDVTNTNTESDPPPSTSTTPGQRPQLRLYDENQPVQSDNVGKNSAFVAKQKDQIGAATIARIQKDWQIESGETIPNRIYELTGENLLANNLVDRYAGKSKLHKQLASWKQISNQEKDNLPDGVYGIRIRNYTPIDTNNNSSGGGKDYSEGALYYVRLGTLLNWVKNNLLIYDGSIDNPYIKLNTNFDTNFCLHFPKQVSANPEICVIPVKDGDIPRKTIEDIKSANDPNALQVSYPTGSTVQYGALPSEFTLTSMPSGSTSVINESFIYSSHIGRLMYIDVNLNFIAKVANDNLDENGNLVLITFLKTLLKGLQASLGYINNFEVIYDREFNQIRIFDNNVLKYSDLVTKKIPVSEFVVNGFENFNLGTSTEPDYRLFGSFIENVDFTTELSNNFSNMVTIASQANTNVLGMDVTGFARFNKGLEDRIIPTKKTTEEINNNNEGLKPEELNKLLTLSKEIIDEIWGNFNVSDTDVDILMSLNRDIANYYVNDSVKRGVIPSPLVIPFNLSLTMMGLSGMKILERFNVDTKILPPMFDNNQYNFIVKALTHEIKNNKWTTVLESQVINKDNNKSLDEPISDVQRQKLKNISSNETVKGCPVPSGWPGPVTYQRTVLTLSEAAAELKRLAPNEKNLQIFTLFVMIQEQGNPIKGFNNNYGGIDITSGGWKFNPDIHDGYVCAKEGGTGQVHAFASFKTKGDSLQFKLNTFRSRGFGANDIENEIDVKNYISTFGGNKVKQRVSKYGTDKGQTYSLKMPKYIAAYYNDWNGWGTITLIQANNDAGLKLRNKYKSERDYISSTISSRKDIWATAKKALGY